MKPSKVEDGGDEENGETTSVIISNEEQINCFDKSPTRQSQQNLVKMVFCYQNCYNLL